ncbi:MAG: fluoride efflux transporter CrcB [candidate division KSB1 bacterium]|nr:fluoride efflux transporter CrcB [candidate division KSB1 bacterium]MDZ7274498.1 fluoride efflux transporter CrcB [candidate division KSB1 bacterium]MDZ7284841.1 fluoride efflux transporter CrcB [candidate division KSB1 bacterium]MDZ7297739.1 fluoride efflux transporter CrcB [candidate division KSB1 bacterium]MDZ7307586.1 fluoride efflux transporter CrcB [candidate division KSB1 bacterium]
MLKIILVGIGGFAGSILRYLLSGYVQQLAKDSGFPLGTAAVNLAGCLVIGLLAQLAERHGFLTMEARLLIVIGFLGGFTTFSTFTNETMNLLRNGEVLAALVNLHVHFVLGLAAVWLGRVLAYLLWR